MTDDLVKRLRETTHMYQVDCELKMKCVARIEELEAKLAEYKMVASAIDNQWAANEDEIAKLKAKTIAFIEFLDANYGHAFGDIARAKIRTLYAELKGETKP